MDKKRIAGSRTDPRGCQVDLLSVIGEVHNPFLAEGFKTQESKLPSFVTWAREYGATVLGCVSVFWLTRSRPFLYWCGAYALLAVWIIVVCYHRVKEFISQQRLRFRLKTLSPA